MEQYILLHELIMCFVHTVYVCVEWCYATCLKFVQNYKILEHQNPPVKYKYLKTSLQYRLSYYYYSHFTKIYFVFGYSGISSWNKNNISDFDQRSAAQQESEQMDPLVSLAE